MLDVSPPHWRDIWYAFLVTGLRRSELTSLTFNATRRRPRGRAGGGPD